MQAFDIDKANKGAKIEYLICGQWIPLFIKNYKQVDKETVSYTCYSGREIELSINRLRLAFETKSNSLEICGEKDV